ncbi:hypothetical protein Tco_1083600, partial [Tanacetum coccineum]
GPVGNLKGRITLQTGFVCLVQLAQGFLLGIFMGITLYHVLGLSGLSIVTIWYVTPLSTSVFDQGFQRVKEVDIGLDEGHDKKLRPADMLLYSWDGGLDVCVDLTGSSPLTQTGMSDFAPGRR